MTRSYQFYCGELTCETRQEIQPDGTRGRLFTVQEDELPDGEVWLCPKHSTAS